MPQRDIEDFIQHWSNASASERANSQLFLAELCDLLDVPRPDNHPGNGYFFEYPVTEHHADGTSSAGRIDLYKRACFVLESKQFQEARAEASQLELAAEEAGVIARKKSSQPVRGTGAWDDAMTKARGQAERYVRALPDDNPPFLIVVDVGHTFELFADFTQAGKAYLPFPDPRSFRIRLADLADEQIRERLRLIWTNPAALDPARQSADVTREVSAHLAELAKSLEQAGHEPETVAQFLTRCLFCMFAEDVELLPDRAFTELLESIPADGSGFPEIMSQLFRDMNTGTGKGVSVVLRKKLLQFNGGLFADDTVLPLNALQLALLKKAAQQNWRNVEPAIFGTLLERALNPDERHQLGAHFTPRAYVERLVLPTLIEPLRAEWANVRAAAVTHARADDLKKARTVVNAFHERLCNLKVLDPACGTGNFLYVSLQQLKVLEGEVLDEAAKYGETFKLELETHTVDPHQFLGLEINPRAAAIAELVLWIGYLQWHFKLHGKRTPPEPILRAFKNIECRDAVLAYDRTEPVLDKKGAPVTRWDGSTIKKHLVTGEDVPDETARVPLLGYVHPRPAEWPLADFIVGNPPFVGTRRMRLILGDGYTEALTKAHPDVPENADFVMYWWHLAALAVAEGKATRFGLITTNSITQVFNRATLRRHLDAKQRVSLVFAIPDHPWVEASDGAAVRVAMTVAVAGDQPGDVHHVENEIPGKEESKLTLRIVGTGSISEDLRIGASPARAVPLEANSGISFWGVKFYGDGFIVTVEEAAALAAAQGGQSLARPFVSGRDFTAAPRHLLAIDCDGLVEHDLATRYVATYQHLLERVKPVREHNPRAFKRERWWIFGENQPGMRASVRGLTRCVMTTETAKHRVFHLMPTTMLAEGTVAVIALDDAFFFGVLSSRFHVVWALATGGRLGVGNDPRYNKTRCFETFPFPIVDEAQKARIHEIAERLDVHRKRQQALHPKLTFTDLYNVLEKLRAGEALTAKEKLIHDQGLVSVLKQLHDDLDAAVFAAYGWQDLWHHRQEAHSGRIWDFEARVHLLLDTGPEGLWEAIAKFESDLDAEILARLVRLNADRAAEEKRGIIHYLRPDYQLTKAKAERGQQKEMELPARPAKTKASKSKAAKRKTAWPSSLSERVQAVEAALHAATGPATSADLAQQFARAKPADVEEILKTLATLGRAHKQGERFTR